MGFAAIVYFLVLSSEVIYLAKITVNALSSVVTCTTMMVEIFCLLQNLDLSRVVVVLVSEVNF